MRVPLITARNRRTLSINSAGELEYYLAGRNVDVACDSVGQWLVVPWVKGPPRKITRGKYTGFHLKDIWAYYHL